MANEVSLPNSVPEEDLDDLLEDLEQGVHHEVELVSTQPTKPDFREYAQKVMMTRLSAANTVTQLLGSPQSSPKLSRKPTLNINSVAAAALVVQKFREKSGYTPQLLIQFDKIVFLREWFYHVFALAAIPVMLFVEGKTGVFNRGFLGFSRNSLTQTVFFILAVAVNIVFFTSKNVTNVEVSEIHLLNCLLLVRNGIIAVKYAYLSPEDIKSRRKELVPRECQVQEMLIQGWANPSPWRLHQELEASMVRQMKYIQNRSFEVSSTKVEAEEALKESIELIDSLPIGDSAVWQGFRPQKNKAGHVDVPVKTMLLQIILTASQEVSEKKLFASAFIAALLQTVLPTIVRLLLGRPAFGENGTEHFLVFSIFVMTMFYLLPNVMFLLVGVIDYRRRERFLYGIGQLLAVSRYHSSYPILRIRSPSNYRSWVLAKRVLRDVGAIFVIRIRLYSSIFLSLTAALMAILLIRIFAEDFNYTMVTLLLYELLVVATPLLLMIVAGARANGTSEAHVSGLLERQAILRDSDSQTEKCLDGWDAAIGHDENQRSDLMIENSIKETESDDHLCPMKFFGFKASIGLTRTVFTAVGTTIFLTIKVLVSGPGSVIAF